jgi:hypothetical protein
LDTNAPINSEALFGIAQTDSAGRYRLEHIPAGRYYITAGELEFPTYFPGVATKTGATIVSVTEGVAFEAQDFQWTVCLTLRGRVLNEGALALPRLNISGAGQGGASQGVWLTQNGVLILTASVSPQGGTFQFRNLLPGQYFVTLEPNIANLPPAEVVLVDKNVEDLRITIPNAVLNGTIRVEGGGLLPAIRLSLTSSVRGSGAKTYPVSEETFSIPIPMGVYDIGVQGLPAGYSVKSITADKSNLLSEKLSLTAASPKIAITLAVSSPPPWVSVLGVLTRPDASRPFPDSITIDGTSVGGKATATVHPDGSFEFPMVLPGMYVVRLAPLPDSLPRTIVVGKSNPAKLEIPMIIPPVKISGRLTGEDRMREQGRLGANEFFQPVLSPRAGPSIRSIRAVNGTFEFPGLQPGTYILNLEKTCSGCDGATVNTSNGTTFVVTDKDMTGLVLSADR